MSAQNPVKITARLGNGENIVHPLFVHEYRCMAASGGGQGHANYSLAGLAAHISGISR
jgi:hypothetical protein